MPSFTQNLQYISLYGIFKTKSSSIMADKYFRRLFGHNMEIFFWNMNIYEYEICLFIDGTVKTNKNIVFSEWFFLIEDNINLVKHNITSGFVRFLSSKNRNRLCI